VDIVKIVLKLFEVVENIKVVKMFKKIMFTIARRVMMKYNIAWVGTCTHMRSPDMFKYPIPECPDCVEFMKCWMEEEENYYNK